MNAPEQQTINDYNCLIKPNGDPVENPKLPEPNTWCIIFTEDGPGIARYRSDMGFSTMKRTRRTTTYYHVNRVVFWKPLDFPLKGLDS